MKNFLLYLVILVVFSSCQTYQTIIPTIQSSPRNEFKLDTPVVIAIKDSRNDVENSAATALSIKNGLKMIYGDNIVFKSYFNKIEDNSVAIKINIKNIGSQFGGRFFQYQTVSNKITATSTAIATEWGTAVSSSISSQPIYQNNFVADGWWIGTTFLDISLVDNLGDDAKMYDFPFIGEDKQSNTWGYKSGKIAARNSWNKVSDKMLDLIDSIMMRLIEVQ